MSDRENKVNTDDAVDSDLFGELVKTSVKTLFYLVLLLSVLAVSFCQLFPYSAAEFHYGMGSYKTAIVYTKQYVNRGENGKNYANAVLRGLEISDLLFYESQSEGKSGKQPASDLKYFTELFAFSSFFEDRCARLDEYYIGGASSVVSLVGLYSYKDYVYTANAKARFALEQIDKSQKADKLLYDGDYTVGQNGFITASEMEQLFSDLCEGDYVPADLSDLAIIFNQLSQNIRLGGGLMYSGGSTTLLYDFLARTVAGYDSDFSFVEAVEAVQSPLKRLYLLDAAVSFTQNITNLFTAENDDYELMLAAEYYRVEFELEEMNLSDYYNAVLNEFFESVGA